MYIERSLEGKIEKYLGIREILAIIGPRQCGKTTLMRHFFERLDNAKFISFEKRDVLDTFVNDIDLFVERYVKGVKYLFIDEFQYARGGGKQLKYIYDTFDTKIIVSGSSAVDLSVQGIKYLVGRIFVLNLYPLSFEEFLKHKDGSLFRIYTAGRFSKPVVEQVNRHYAEFLVYGGYPRVVLAGDREEKEDALSNIYNTYLLKEIREIIQLPEDFKLVNLAKILAFQTGGIANYNEIMSSTGLSYRDLLRNLSILKKTFVCAESRPYFTNKKKELVKAPKVFFLDNGFRNVIAGNFQALADRADAGQLGENFVASELVKKGIELRYWRTKAKAEVDFIVESAGALLPMEVKSNLAEPKLTRSFVNFLEAYRPKRGIILSSNIVGKRKIGSSSVEFLPVSAVGMLVP